MGLEEELEVYKQEQKQCTTCMGRKSVSELPSVSTHYLERISVQRYHITSRARVSTGSVQS